jgi:hypothetical protein
MVGGRFALEESAGQSHGVAFFSARDTKSGAAASVLLVPLDRLGQRRRILEADLRKAAGFSHRNVAAVLAFGAEANFFYAAFERADGHSLRRAIAAQAGQGKPVGAQTAHTLLGHAANGLAQAYNVMAHGALSPESLIVGRDGRVVIEAWGLCQGLPEIARRGTVEGGRSPYLAPELENGGLPTAQADVYALGAILYELVTGDAPGRPLRPPSQIARVPPALDAVVAKALSSNPLGRQGTPQVLLSELGGAIGAGPAASSPGAPRATSSLGVPRVTGRTFNVAEAAGLSTDAERWLVQQGKLDFGPFTMAQLMAQIDRGAFRVDDVLVDMESGQRQKLKDHPQLGEFTRKAERRLEADRRAVADRSLDSAEKKKGRFSLVIVAVALAVVGSGLGLYLVGRNDASEAGLAGRVGEEDIDAFLSKVKIAFNQPRRPSAPKRRPGGPAAAGARAGDEFSGDQVLGDVTQGGGDAVLDEGAIQQVMMSNYKKLIPCVMQERTRNPGLYNIDLDFVVRGAGNVSAVKVNGQEGGPFAGCLLDRMKVVRFPKFDGAKTIASWSMSIR